VRETSRNIISTTPTERRATDAVRATGLDPTDPRTDRALPEQFPLFPAVDADQRTLDGETVSLR
jgi:hypothetical protein